MKYAIIEDERYSRDSLKYIMEKLRPDYKLEFSSQSVVDSVELLSLHTDLDFIFMDVELSDGICFDIFNAIDVVTPIIFTTAYDEYAVKSYKVNSIYYLLKPISEDDVEAALIKLESRVLESNKASAIEKNISNPRVNRFLIYKGNNISYVNVSDISFFLSEENYVYAFLKNGQHPITTFTNLKDLYDKLDHNLFFQLSRNIITSVDGISKISKYFRGRLVVTLSYGTQCIEVTVSASRRAEFLSWLGN